MYANMLHASMQHPGMLYASMLIALDYTDDYNLIYY
jgi:hypothetical protein